MFSELMNNGLPTHDNSGYHVDFLFKKTNAGNPIELADSSYNYLIFILQGTIRIEYNGFNEEFGKDNIVFMLSNSSFKIESVDDSVILVDAFQRIDDIYDIDVLESYQYQCAEVSSDFVSVPMKNSIKQSLDLLLSYMDEEIAEPEMLELKHREIILLLRWYYSREEYVILFREIICKSLEFKSKVLAEYLKTKSIDELAAKLGLSKIKFEIKFKETFGISPKQWIVKNISKRLKLDLSKPEISIDEIMTKYDFESKQQFDRFCKRQFGIIPHELKKDH